MCGIFGFVGDIARESALLCTNMLAHRGPDGCGLWEGNGITLGHRRLSILDLSAAGAQPMSFADGRYQITYNGEIYNFIEIRKELSDKGHSFVSDSDTEVLLAAFSEWGEKCLLKLNGMWAFAIWDSIEQALFISRDRFGKKPLFYTATKSGFAFASEMKALFPVMCEVRPNSKLVREATTDYNCFNYEHTADTLIEGINRFPAGHSGWLRQGRLQLSRWWCTLDHLPTIPDRYEEQVEVFRELFIDACKLRMRSDVPIGTALSGGLDSSATISVMAHISKTVRDERSSTDWQHAFVACFPGTFLDESRYARMVTDHLGINATFVDIDPLAVLDRLENYIYLFEDLYITSPIPFMMTYGSMRQKNVRVTIDGHGADELFAGYTFDFIHALKDAGCNVHNVRSVLHAYCTAYSASADPKSVPSAARTFLNWHADNILKTVFKRRVSSQDEKHPCWKRLDALSKVLYISAHETVLPTLLRNYDRYSMANGVEIRMPFMDHRIVCFASSLPWDSKIRGGFSKSIIRDAVAPFMPHEIAYRRSKIGFNTPFVEWLQGPLRGYFEDVLSSTAFRQSELIEPDAISALLRKILDNPDASFDSGVHAWTAIMPFFWEQHFLKGWKGRIKSQYNC
ncbi:MAG: asparagine synthase (glutamine-hydrolyzing) [Geobacteraceae bacterium]|nr:asparagine synthase (glutamine-hydrolyzing) [Geobacteraceae bacterium]